MASDETRGVRREPLATTVGDRWAIVIGISRYRQRALDLRYADRDASEFHAFLNSPEGGGFRPQNVMLLLNEEATTANVTRALRSFLKRPDRDDLVVIYFACHGSPDPERPGNVYLLTHDVDRADISGTALPMREIDLALRENLHAKHVVIIADTCHSAAIGSGPGTRSVTSPSDAVNTYLQAVSASKGGVALLTSAEANEVSFEDARWGGGHGVFTHYLLTGMRGAADRDHDGVVTVGELFEYVRERVKEATNHRQHPAIGTTQFDRALPMSVTGMPARRVGIDAATERVDDPVPGGSLSAGTTVGVSAGPWGRKRRVLGTVLSLLVVLPLASWSFNRWSAARSELPVVEVLPFLSAAVSSPGQEGLGSWLQQEVMAELVAKGWRITSAGTDSAVLTERLIQSRNSPGASAERTNAVAGATRVVGGLYHLVRSDSVVVEALVVEIGTGQVVAAGSALTTVARLADGVDTLTSQLLAAVSAAPRSSSMTESAPQQRAAANDYVHGLLRLARGELADARAAFAKSVARESAYTPATRALAAFAGVNVDRKPTVGVIPFMNGGGPLQADSVVSSLGALKLGLSDLLITDLAAGPVVVLERTRLGEIWAEQQRSQEKMVDPGTAAKIGKMLSAEFLITGSYILLDKNLAVTAQIVDVGTERVLERFTVQAPLDSLFEALSRLGRDLRSARTWQASPTEALNRFRAQIGLPTPSPPGVH